MITAKTINNLRTNWPDVASPQMECLLLIQRTARLLMDNAQQALSSLNLSFAEFEVLAALRASPPPHKMLPTELYEAMLISSGGLTKVLKGLEEDGFIARPRQEGDKRCRPVALLPKGRKAAEKGFRMILDTDDQALSEARINQADFKATSATLLRLAAALEQCELAHT